MHQNEGVLDYYVPDAVRPAIVFALAHPQLYDAGIRPGMGLTDEQLDALSYGLNTGCDEAYIRALANHPELPANQMLDGIQNGIPVEKLARDVPQQAPGHDQPEFDWEE